MTSITEDLRGRFRELHQQRCSAIPNLWDAGNAKLLEHQGFKAVRHSADYAWSQGQRDTQLSLSKVLEHLRQMVRATSLPVRPSNSWRGRTSIGSAGSTYMAAKNGRSHDGSVWPNYLTPTR